MKQVINSKPPNTVDVTEFDENKYYGFLRNDNFKGFCFCSNNSFRVAWRLAATKGNYTVGFDSFEKLFFALQPYGKFYEFDTYQELFKWLSE